MNFEPAQAAALLPIMRVWTLLNESEPEKLLDNRELKKVCFDYAKSNFQGKRFYKKNLLKQY
ncbi:MAG: hypothetical protein LBG74_02805 [Spirochaetaceae bacterium]|jgi:hypothetical protein|nr:hypothetical protein [Spirochaetaceae bacterium]